MDGPVDGPGDYALPCNVNSRMQQRVLNFDSSYMNVKIELDNGMKATIALSDKASSSGTETSVSFYPSGSSASTACVKPVDGTWNDYPVRLVRSGRYFHHWYMEKVNCNGDDNDTRIELKVTPDCVELYMVSNSGAQDMNWLRSGTLEKLSSSVNGYAGISYCVECSSEINGSSDSTEDLSGCKIVKSQMPTDCCLLSPTNGNGDFLCGKGWTYQTCGVSAALTTALTKDVTITSPHTLKGNGHSFEIWVPRGSGSGLSNVVTSFDINNNANTWRKVKLNFHIDNPRRHTGALGILRDMSTKEPTGIHVQMSKNWHLKEDLYNYYWWTGVAHVRVPPGKTSLELVVAYQYYKGLHGVSHSQLSLLGWGVNGLWEEVGLGSNGESITFEPHGHHRRQMILDTRPWLVCQMNVAGCAGTPDNTQWTENIGGGDFLVAVDSKGMYQYLVEDTVLHTMTGPRLTNATYAGITVDQNIAVTRTVSTWTADDLVRHLHSFNYTFLRELGGNTYPRFALYTLGGDNYNYVRFPFFAYGAGTTNALLQQDKGEFLPIKDVINGVTDFKYTSYYQVDAPVGCGQGNNDPCWFAMMTDPSMVHHRGNRGIVIRNFHGQLNGKAWPPADRDVSPFAFHLIKSRQNGAAQDTVSIELALPSEFKNAVESGTAKFHEGDYLMADIELVIPPRQTADYIGNSQRLKTWLTDAAVDSDFRNGWKVISKEAVMGNAIKTTVFKGTLERKYHPRIHVDSKDEARFNIAIPAGMPGILPITIAGVEKAVPFRTNLLQRPNEKLWRYVGGAWTEFGENGNYQLEKDVFDNSYTYVYSLRLEFETNAVVPCESFAFGAAKPTDANPSC
eukprot:jgi/Psemu1/13907/gm1.13907_g